MDFSQSREQVALGEAVRGLLMKSRDSHHAGASSERGNRSLWNQLADMGVLGLPFAESDGGAGAGPVEVSIVAESIGRELARQPFVEAVVLAGGVVAAIGTATQRAELLPALADGTTTLLLAHSEPSARYCTAAVDVTATQGPDGWLLDGVKEPVVTDLRADIFIVSARMSGGSLGLFLVDHDVTGLEVTQYPALDGGTVSRLQMTAAASTPLGDPGPDRTAELDLIFACAQIAYCHEALGAMACALERTVEYLRTRRQFGAPLSSFQSLKFRAADMYVTLELARSVAQWATLVLADPDSQPSDIIAAARHAKLSSGKASRLIGKEAIQMHGGIGLSAEFGIGNYTSRLTVIDHTLGDGRFHLGVLADGVNDHRTVEPLG
jgi:alkylation response protein AidB-like acyl-CoA dehydrogenase